VAGEATYRPENAAHSPRKLNGRAAGEATFRPENAAHSPRGWNRTFIFIEFEKKDLTINILDDIGKLFSRIIGLLALIAISGLWERNRRLQRIVKLTNDTRVANEISERTLNNAASFFGKVPARFIIERYIYKAASIQIAGINLSSTLVMFLPALLSAFLLMHSYKLLL